MVRRGDVVDVLIGEDEALVLTSGQCLRLNALAAAIVESLSEPLERSDLEARLEQRFGTAPPGRLDGILDELAAQGVIEIAPEIG